MSFTFYEHLLAATSFMPHGICYRWKPGLVGIHLVSNAIIALSYFSIPFSLVNIVRRRRDLPFDWIFFLFAAFIIFCGLGHSMDIWTLWHADYWFSGYIRAITALVSVVTAIALVYLGPKILSLPSPSQMEEANQRLVKEITERKQVEEELRQSEQRWQLAVKGTKDGVFDWNIITNEVFMSPQLKEMLGYKEEEIADNYQGWRQLVHPDDLERVEQKIQAHLEGQTSQYSCEYRMRCKNDSYKWILARGMAWNQEGKPIRMVGSHQDISNRKEAEEKIREQAVLIDIATDAIFVRDLDNRILFWSQGAERLYGWTATESLGKQALELFEQESMTQIEERLQITLEKGNWQGEIEQVKQDGTEIIVASRWTLMKDDSGQPKSILVVNTDITEKKQIEQQFYRAQRLESLGVLASGIAHDLNNIFTPILGIAQLLPLKLSGLDEQTQQLLVMLKDNSNRGAQMVQQILTFARGAEGKRIPLQVEYLLLDIAKIARQTFLPSIEIDTDIPTRKLWTVKGDPTQLHQVFMNLAVNARDAMPSGGRLSFSAQNCSLDAIYASMNLDAQEGNYVVISVSDTGIGIPPAQKERIFEPFFTTKAIGKGTGLGLSTALGIVKNHGGFIEVLSEVDKGTIFKVYLPASEKKVIEPSEDKQLPQGNGELILIVDDEAAVRQITQATLEEYNYSTLVAVDGLEAIALYTQHQKEIKVVLIDLMMPKMDGLTAINVLRKINPQVKIFATSGLLTNIKKVFSAGAKDFLAKPYTTKDLLNKLSSLIASIDS